MSNTLEVRVSLELYDDADMNRPRVTVSSKRKVSANIDGNGLINVTLDALGGVQDVWTPMREKFLG